MSSDEAALLALWRALGEVKLEAILVGSAAAAAQGAPVTTQDFDLLVRDSPTNRKKLEALARLLNAARPRALSELSNALTILGSEVPVDILLGALPGRLSFESVRSRCVRIPLADVIILAAALEDIIRSKEAAGRPKDLAQLPILRDTLRVMAELRRSPPPRSPDHGG